MQATLPAIPTPEAQTLAMAVLFFIGGMAVPTKYGIERVEGFGRAVAARIPYKSPPGQDEQQAMARAVYGPDAVDSGEQPTGDSATPTDQPGAEAGTEGT